MNGMNRREYILPSHYRQKEFNHLLSEILKRHMQPEDPYEIAALLESLGWNDHRVQNTFGAQDVFELANEIWSAIQRKVVFVPFAGNQNNSKKDLIIELLRSFLRGLIFALPMAISVFSMITLKFSLWSYEYLSVELATCIAIGTIMSFVNVGGYTQAIARRGFFYIYQGYYNMAKRITFYFIRIGYISCILLSVFVYIFNLVFNLFPFQTMLIYIIVYFFFLNAIWLSVTVMYILRRELTFTGLIILGIGFVYVIKDVLGFDIIVAQIISLLLISLIGSLLVLYYFKSEEKRSEKSISIKLPRMSITLYSIAPYFYYGFLYFTFLFVDRVMAWSVNDQGYMPYVIWFRGQYELGLDFALMALIIPMGVSEVIVSKLMYDLIKSQKIFLGHEAPKMSKMYLSMYFRMFLIVIVTTCISAILCYWGVHWLGIKMGREFLADPITHFVFIVALISYVILSVFLMNAVILFSLSQPFMVTNVLTWALILNVVTGFLLTRWVHYSFAVFGPLIGSIILMIYSTFQVRKVLKNLDYYLYAAS